MMQVIIRGGKKKKEWRLDESSSLICCSPRYTRPSAMLPFSFFQFETPKKKIAEPTAENFILII